MGDRYPLKIATFLGQILFWPLVLAAVVTGALEIGAWQLTETHVGPFAVDPFAGSVERANRSVAFKIVGTNPADCCLAIRTDENKYPTQSQLRLWINGKERSPSHVPHDEIRSGANQGFSFWARYVVFSLKPGQLNDATLLATVRYPLSPPRNLAFVLSLVSLGLGALIYRRLFVRTVRVIGDVVRPRLEVALLSAYYLCLLASILYIVSIFYAAIQGWAFPTTAIIRNVPLAAWLAENIIYLGYALLTIASVGIFTGRASASVTSLSESLAGRWFWPSAFVVVSCLFVFSASGSWAGLVRPGDLQGSNIGGLIAFSDSGGHLSNAYDQALNGTFSQFAMRRPIAAAFRSTLLMVSSYSLPTMILVQLVLLSLALCFATWSVARWRGAWTGLVFFSLTFIYVRPFSNTTLTEPLSLIWALASIPFFVEAMRCKSRNMALIAVGMTMLALMTRMGSMFTIPALVLWFFVAFGDSLKSRVFSAVAACGVIACVLVANYTLEKLHGTLQNVSVSNFSYTLCGLTIGTTWDGCLKQLEKGGVDLTEAQRTAALYSQAQKNFRANPFVLFNRLGESAGQFLADLPSVMLDGYLRPRTEPWWFPRIAVFLIAIVGAVAFVRRRTGFELVFWALMLASIFVSASIVYFDDGNRVLAASFPLLALFIALTSTVLVERPDAPALTPRLGKLGLLLLAGGALSLFTPWLAYAARGKQPLVPAPVGYEVYGRQRMTGFLVVADGDPLRHDVPTLHFDDFKKIVNDSGIELYQGLLRPEKPTLPFAFVFAPRVAEGTSDFQYIAPPEVLERREIPRWRFDLKQWNRKAGPYWYYVTKATPIGASGP